MPYHRILFIVHLWFINPWKRPFYSKVSALELKEKEIWKHALRHKIINDPWDQSDLVRTRSWVKNENWRENVFYDLLWLESGKSEEERPSVDWLELMFSLQGICAGISRLRHKVNDVLLPRDDVLMMFKLTLEPPDMERCQNSTVTNQRKVSFPKLECVYLVRRLLLRISRGWNRLV